MLEANFIPSDFSLVVFFIASANCCFVCIFSRISFTNSSSVSCNVDSVWIFGMVDSGPLSGPPCATPALNETGRHVWVMK